MPGELHIRLFVPQERRRGAPVVRGQRNPDGAAGVSLLCYQDCQAGDPQPPSDGKSRSLHGCESSFLAAVCLGNLHAAYNAPAGRSGLEESCHQRALWEIRQLPGQRRKPIRDLAPGRMRMVLPHKCLPAPIAPWRCSMALLRATPQRLPGAGAGQGRRRGMRPVPDMRH